MQTLIEKTLKKENPRKDQTEELNFDSDSDADSSGFDYGNGGACQWLNAICFSHFSCSSIPSIIYNMIISRISSSCSADSNNNNSQRKVMTPSLVDRIKSVVKVRGREDKQDLLDKRKVNPSYNASSQYVGQNLEIGSSILTEPDMQQVTIDLDNNSDEEANNAEENTSNNSNNNTVDRSVYYI